MSRLIALLAVLVLALAACGGAAGSGAVIATVDETDITEGELDSLRPGGTTETAQAADDLNLLISTQIVQDGAVDLGVEITDEAITDATDELVAGIEGQGQTYDEFLAENDVTEDLVELAMTQQVAQQELMAYFQDNVEVSEQEIQDQYEIEMQSRSNVCAAHILIGFEDDPEASDEDNAAAEDEAEATATEVYELSLEEGADFGELAMEYSTGPSGPTGGDLGCSAPNSYVPSFAQATLDAEIGVPYGPVQTQFGFHVILVNERTVPELSEIETELEENVAFTKATEEIGVWYQETLRTAEVTIEPEFGTWEEDEQGYPRVVAPTA